MIEKSKWSAFSEALLTRSVNEISQLAWMTYHQNELDMHTMIPQLSLYTQFQLKTLCTNVHHSMCTDTYRFRSILYTQNVYIPTFITLFCSVHIFCAIKRKMHFDFHLDSERQLIRTRCMHACLYKSIGFFFKITYVSVRPR